MPNVCILIGYLPIDFQKKWNPVIYLILLVGNRIVFGFCPDSHTLYTLHCKGNVNRDQKTDAPRKRHADPDRLLQFEHRQKQGCVEMAKYEWKSMRCSLFNKL